MAYSPRSSVIIATCTNPKCNARYEVKTFQSKRLCENCKPPTYCAHTIPTTEPCVECEKITRSKFIRSGVSAGTNTRRLR